MGTLLIDPFYAPGAAYSETSTGVRELIAGVSYVAGAIQLVGLLQDAGWSTVDASPSVANQNRSAFYFQVNSGSGTPAEMTAAQCTSHQGPNWRRFSLAGVIYHSYDPYLLTPTCAGGTGGIVWFEAGSTTSGTAQNLAIKITEMSPWDCSYTGDSGGYSLFTLTSKASAFEYDELAIGIGGGDRVSVRGYYTLRSPVLDGQYLEVKIETRLVGHLGAFITYDSVGAVRICLTVTSSQGGSYYQPLMPGRYYAVANNWQVVIWPSSGTPNKNASSSLMAAMIRSPESRPPSGNAVVVVGSDNGDITVPLGYDQLRKASRWAGSVATSHGGPLAQTFFRSGVNTGYQKLAMLVRGTKGRATTSASGQPMIQAPYILLPSSPNSGGTEAAICGKLWDIVMTSGGATVGARMIHDEKIWMCFSTDTPIGDVVCDMWILEGAS